MHTRDSIAFGGSGIEVPETIEIFTVSGADRPDKRDADGKHTVFQWDGNEYSRKNTWIMADDDTIEDLEGKR